MGLVENIQIAGPLSVRRCEEKLFQNFPTQCRKQRQKKNHSSSKKIRRDPGELNQ